MDRRDFIDLRRLAHDAAQALGVGDKLQALARDVAGEAVLLRFKRRAMATNFEIMLPFGTPDSHAAAIAGLDEIDRLEAQLTVYRDSSEMSLVNQHAARVPVKVEPNLFELLSFCKSLHGSTEGAFDVAVGALIKTWGFFKRQGRVPSPDELAAARASSGMAHVRLDAESRMVAYDVEGLEINLGSVGKGFALDAVIGRLNHDGRIGSALVHGGQSSVFGLGMEPGTDRGWQVALKDPVRTKRTLGMFTLRNRGLGISAATHQHLLHEGRRLGHILDPRSGWPAEGVACAAVTASTAAEADALATAFFILGIDKARAYVEAHPVLGAVLVPQRAARPVILGRAAEEFAPRA